MYGSIVTRPHAARQHRRAGTTLALVGAAIDLALAAGLGALRATNGSIGERHVEGPLPTLAIVLALAAPGIVAVIGVVIDRPVLFGAAGIACLPLVIVSIAAVPIWIAGGLFTIAFVRSTSTQRSLSLLGGLVLVGFQAPILVGLWILITETHQFTYNFAGGSEGGEYFTPGHALLCIVIVTLDLFVVTVLARLSPAPPA
jgi:hypothetical protein